MRAAEGCAFRKGGLSMAPVSRRQLISAAAAAQVAVLATGCAAGDENSPRKQDVEPVDEKRTTPFEFGATGDGRNDDTVALRKAYDSALSQGGGSIDLVKGRFYIPGHLEMDEPGVSLIGNGGASVGGGEVRLGPITYDKRSSGVDFSGDCISGVVFDQGDDYGTKRCLVLRNVRGLDITQNTFRSAGKGVAVEGVDGNDKPHTTAMLRVSGNRFGKLAFGVYGDTPEWDRLSDWQVTDNYFNFCSDTSVWIASSDEGEIGGVDGLVFSGNTIFSMNFNANSDARFALKRYNLRLGKTNWLRIINNSFFEAGLSAVYLDTPQKFTFVGNHVAWPGQRELADAVEIHNGAPTGVIEGNTFASWTRAAIGLYNLTDLSKLEIGQNAWNWNPNPDSWLGSGSLPGYRVFASEGGAGTPQIRDYQESGAHDDLAGSRLQTARDVKSPKGGICGAFRHDLDVSDTASLFRVSDAGGATNYGGLLSITAINASNDSLVSTYVLFVSSQNSVCTIIHSGGLTDGLDAEHPSFEFLLSDNVLKAAPVGSTRGTFNFDAVGLGAVSLT